MSTATLRPKRKAWQIRDGITPEGRYTYTSVHDPLDYLSPGQEVVLLTTDHRTFHAVVEIVESDYWPQEPASAVLRIRAEVKP